MLISPEQEALIGRVFESYLAEHHHGDLLQLPAGADEDAHRAVVVNAMTLFEANMEVGDYFNAYPHDVLAIFDKVLHRKAQELTDEAAVKHNEAPRMRRTLHARVTGLPVCPELTRVTVPRSRDVGHFLSLTGTVIRTSVAKVLESERDYMCSKCRHVFTVHADFQQHYSFVPPAACPHPEGCGSARFCCLSAGSEPALCRDYQEVKIQEQVQRLSVGSIPRSLVVVLEDDLVDSCKSGDDVTVFGVMCLRWRPFYEGSPCDVELVLKANNLEVNNQQAAAALLVSDVRKEFEDFWSDHRLDPVAGRNKILLSLCPQVFGMYVIKLAVAMVLAGGVQRTDSSGTKIRGECHMLLVGDPGTGKSQFLKYAAKIMSRSVLTAGIGSTSAGLTVAAVKDGGDWHLEAGALVLADGGLCCIDEFSSIKEHDRISIHEAMEQQSISVAKAGMVCKLNTRTTILAATNPKGPYNSSEPVSVNVALASPLLSRFDLVLVLLDTKNAEWDRVISSFILEDRGLPAESSGLWPVEKMKAYFGVIRRLQPQLSDDANLILARYYQLQRRSDGRNAARTTVRMLESLSRLAEAHARLMFRETVTIEDAVLAVSLMECSMQGGGLLGNVNALLTSFPDDPARQYRTQCELLLEGLNLPLLLHKEALRLDRRQNITSEDFHRPSIPDEQNQTEDEASEASGGNIFSDLQRDVNGLNTSSLFPDDPVTFHPFTSTPRHPDRKSNSGQSDVSAGTSEETDSSASGRKAAERKETLQSESRGDETLVLEEGAGGGGVRPTAVSSGGTWTKSLSSALREKVQSEAGQDLHDKLSSFVFKPKKMRPADHSHDSPAASGERTNRLRPVAQQENTVENTSNPLRPVAQQENTVKNTSNPLRPVAQQENTVKNTSNPLRPVAQLENTVKNTSNPLRPVAQLENTVENTSNPLRPVAQQENTVKNTSNPLRPVAQLENTVENTSNPLRPVAQLENTVKNTSNPLRPVAQQENTVKNTSNPLRPVAQQENTVENTSNPLQKLKKAQQEKTGSRRKRKDDAEVDDNVTVTPPGEIQSSVGAAAVAKLSRFSFTSEPQAAATERRPPDGGDAAVVHSPLRKKRRSSPAPENKRDAKTESAHGGVLLGSHHPGSVSVKKRRCFQLGSSSHAAHALFSGLPESNCPAAGQDDVFDTDWDQEVI